MKYIVEEPQIDRIIKPFFEEHFGTAKYGNWKTDGVPWEGIYKDENDTLVVLLGFPIYDTENRWYSNGQYFRGWWDMFGLEPSDFNESMKRFVNKKFKLNINEIL